MEGEPSEENVSYLDEYPELKKKVWLRRLAAQRQLGETAVTPMTRVYQFPTVTELPRRNPDDAS
jgi:hypothetical protein